LAGGVLALVLLGGGDDGGGERTPAQDRREAREEPQGQAGEERQAPAQEEQQEEPAAPAPAPAPPADEGGGSGYEVPQPSGDDVDEAARLQLQGHNMIDSDPEGAVPILERSVEAFPPGTDDIRLQYAYYSLGRALRLAGRPDDAIPVLELRLKHPDQRDTVQRELDAAREAAAG
jgi:hypothetical protein